MVGDPAARRETSDDELNVRLTRHGDAVRVQYAIGGNPWQMARLAPFPAAAARVGIMACSPERAGSRANFNGITVSPPIDKKLHANWLPERRMPARGAAARRVDCR